MVAPQHIRVLLFAVLNSNSPFILPACQQQLVEKFKYILGSLSPQMHPGHPSSIV